MIKVEQLSDDITIINGDCVEVLDRSVFIGLDLCVTSPPYNLGIDYKNQDDDLDLDEYYAWCGQWMSGIYGALSMGGRLALNHYLSCGSAKRRWAPLMDLNHIAEDIGYKHHGLAVWSDATLSKRTAWGSWLSASAPYVNCPYEGILILYKGDWHIGRGVSSIEKDEFMESTSGVWNLAPEKNREHPAPFPISLPTRCINLLTFVGGTVLDPFMGSGTTGVACVQTGRKFIGIEIEQEYYEMAKERLIKEIEQN